MIWIVVALVIVAVFFRIVWLAAKLVILLFALGLSIAIALISQQPQRRNLP